MRYEPNAGKVWVDVAACKAFCCVLGNRRHRQLIAPPPPSGFPPAFLATPVRFRPGFLKIGTEKIDRKFECLANVWQSKFSILKISESSLT